MNKNFLKNCEGSVIVEFTLIALCFFAFIPVIFDLTAIVGGSMTLSGAVRAGTQYAIAQPDSNSNITQIIKTASGFPAENVIVSITQFCQCMSQNIACGTVCSDGTGAKTFNTINASYPVPTILPYGEGQNSNTYTISQYATIQVK